jgi:Fe-S-cluster containining protein
MTSAISDSPAQISDAAKQHLRALTEQTRRLARERIREARGKSSVEEQAALLAGVARASVAQLEHEVARIFASPQGAAVERAIECKKGCAFCCYLDVAITIVEAIAVAATIRYTGRTDLVVAVNATAPLLRGLDATTRQRKLIPCPMLKDSACTIYDVRPSVCRAYLSMNAKECEDDLDDRVVGGPGKDVTTFAAPRVFGAALNAGIRTACAEEGLQDCAVELTAAAHLILKDETAIARWLAGEAVFQPYV